MSLWKLKTPQDIAVCKSSKQQYQLWPMLYDMTTSIFLQRPVSDRHDIDMGVIGYVSDTRTQFRHANPLNLY